jgi:maltooligosyltrehalose trehalohydrolase
VLDWTEPTQPPHARLLDWYRLLIGLRRSEPDLASGDLDGVGVECGPDDAWLVVRRGSLRVVVVLGEEPALVPLDAAGTTRAPSALAAHSEPTPPTASQVHVLATWDEAVPEDGGIRLAGRSVAVVRLDPVAPATARSGPGGR